MPEFAYQARELSGRQVNGEVTAANVTEAIKLLSGRGLFPSRVTLSAGAQAEQKASGRRVKSRLLAIFYSQLGDLLQSGVPLMRSLEILADQTGNQTLKAALQDVRDQVAEGNRLGEAMRRHPKVFSELAVSMVRAGEEGGFLDEVLKRVAVFVDHQEDLKSRVMGAMIYPAFLMCAGGTVVIGMLVFFVPQFAPIFARLRERGELPAMTDILIQSSAFLKVYGIWILTALGIGLYYLWNHLQSEKGRMLADQIRLKIPGVGSLIRSLAIARFCRILGTLLKNGVPILLSLRIAKDAMGNQVLSDAIAHAAENISAGKSLARPLAASGQFPRQVVEMIAVGEEANNLEQVLLDIAETSERHTYRQLDLVVRMVEPLMLLAMAIVILFMVIALLLPVMKSSTALG